jgi:NTE family protein
VAGSRSAKGSVAFVLGGGGHLGAYEVGMLRALLERDIVPELVVGTSVGALNGAAIAARPELSTVAGLETTWKRLAREPVFGSSLVGSLQNLMQSRTALYRHAALRRVIRESLPVHRFEDLAVPFQCVAVSIERASEHWFSSGPLEPAILASASVPGLLPPLAIHGEHFYDGGLVNSIPLDRATLLGATTIFVLHVGRIEQPLRPPRHLLDVPVVSFEISRRHRFQRALESVPPDVTVHVLPTGAPSTGARDSAPRRTWTAADVEERVTRAHAASLRYLRQL